jgi:hypothetical protein
MEYRAVPGPAGRAGAPGARQRGRRRPADTQATGDARPGRTGPDLRGDARVRFGGRAGEPSDATAKPQHEQQADRAGQRGYRDEVPRFMDMWAKHEGDWAETRRHTADLPTDAPGPITSML